MTPFLKLVADDIYEKFNGRLEDVAVVFPNKRASLFFSKYLLEKSGGKAMWSPRYMTIGELFQKNSNLAICDPLLLVSKLYKEYVRSQRADESPEEYEKSIETLDSFYYWGEMLLRDFDDVDKHLANAKQLFANIKELREMGTAKGTLTPEQAKSIEQFFKNFKAEEKSELKQNFVEIWERLYTIYSNFKNSLRASSQAYEGMLYRDVIENSDNISLEFDMYAFVGFNALNDVERRMFEIIDKRKKALFYWDYDTHYTGNRRHEAGHFMRKNLELFPNALKGFCFNELSNDKNITVIEAGNESIETRYLSTWLNENLGKEEIDTAVVLCDETMLEPVLHTIPPVVNGHKLKHMNVTMGFPVSHTPIFTLIKQILELNTRGWSARHNCYILSFVGEILNHPYVVRCSNNAITLRDTLHKEKKFFPKQETLAKDDFLSLLFARSNDNKEWLDNMLVIIRKIADEYSDKKRESMELYEKLFCEAIYKVYTQVQRLANLVDTGELQLEQHTLGKLLVRILTMQSLPFHGEPIMGLQIMGLLETRNLDFKNVILLGVNEGNIPKKSRENSYIPYNLRRAFGLTLSEHRDSIYAYCFYRLLQRAGNVTLVYNNSSESKHRGECSRYILQLLGSGLYDIKHLALSSNQGNKAIVMGSIAKNPDMMQKLRERFDRSVNENAKPITPSAVNRYLKCGLSFFYYYILGIKKSSEINDEVQLNDFGTIFHKAADELYSKLSIQGNGTIYKETLEPYIKNDALLYKFVDDAFSTEFFQGNKVEYNGEQYINRGVLHHFLLKLIKIDSCYAPFRYIGGERDIAMPYTINVNGESIETSLGGTIDRVDIKGDTINIVDYKTGRINNETKTSIENIFAGEIQSAGNRLQAFLYSIILDELIGGKEPVGKGDFRWVGQVKAQAARKISPSLLYVQAPENTDRKNFIVDVLKSPVTDISTIKDEYMQRFDAVLKEIFDVNTPFGTACNEENCEYCDYRRICGK